MPLPLIAAALPAVASAVGSIVSNTQNRRFSREMYERQRQDNIEFWNMQNAYNDPSQQMARLKDAGLNPNLVYGGSSGGAAGQAGNIATPDVQPVTHRYPDGEHFNLLAEYFDTQIKQAQHNNLLAKNTTELEEAELKRAQRESILAKTERTLFDTEFEKELRTYSADQRKEALRAVKIQNQNRISEEERRATQHKLTLQEKAEAIAHMRLKQANTREERKRIQQAIKNMKKDGRLKQMDIELKRLGISPNAPFYFQWLGRYMSNNGINFKSDY